VTNKTPILPLPVLRFSQPFNRFNATSDLQVYSTLQALRGFGLQSFTLRRSSYVVRIRAPSSLPALHDFLPLLADIPAYHHHGGLSVPMIKPNRGPFVPLRRLASILGFSRPWSFVPALKLYQLHPSFTRKARQQLSWPSTPSGVLPITLVALPLLRFETSIGFFCNQLPLPRAVIYPS